MLCESLMLLLVQEKLIDKEQVLEAIDLVIDVKKGMAGKRESVVVSVESINLLRDLARSISSADDPRLTSMPPAS